MRVPTLIDIFHVARTERPACCTPQLIRPLRVCLLL